MQPEIRTLSERKLVGKHLQMSLNNNRTFELWNSFMPRRKEITNTIGADLFSLQLYDANYFSQFNPSNLFEKWALMEVSDFCSVPSEMSAFTLSGGLYAVFNFKGTSQQAPEMFKYILLEWLPASKYELDDRPHFEILGEKYKREHPDSEEEIWIPIRSKQ